MRKLNQNTKLLVFLALLLGVLNFFIPPIKTEASGQYFGGKITSKISCEESGGYQLTIVGPNGNTGTYLYNSPQKEYNRKKVQIRKWVMGKYTTGGECIVSYYPDIELPIEKGTITSIATS